MWLPMCRVAIPALGRDEGEREGEEEEEEEEESAAAARERQFSSKSQVGNRQARTSQVPGTQYGAGSGTCTGSRSGTRYRYQVCKKRKVGIVFLKNLIYNETSKAQMHRPEGRDQGT